jgi:hypothetical protein
MTDVYLSLLVLIMGFQYPETMEQPFRLMDHDDCGYLQVRASIPDSGA